MIAIASRIAVKRSQTSVFLRKSRQFPRFRSELHQPATPSRISEGSRLQGVSSATRYYSQHRQFQVAQFQFTAAEPSNRMTVDVADDYTIDPDVQRMLRVREDDHVAFEELVEAYQNRVVGLLTHMTADKQAAEDLAQEVFLRVYRARVGYEPTARFSTWLFRITQNVAFNSRRSKSRRKESNFRNDLSGSQSAMGAENKVADRSALMPTRRVDSNETQEIVREAVMRLAERQRMALLLHKFEGMSYADVGDAMDLTVSAVKSLLSRARESLRQELETYMARPE